MKTPMQELLKEVINAREIAMDINFRSALDFVRDAIEQDYLEKEKEVMVEFAYNCRNLMAGDEFAITHWYDKTFNSQEK